MILNCDLYDASVEAMGGPADLLFDRGSLVALPLEDNSKYAQKVAGLMKAPGSRYLLVVYDYDRTLMKGPPNAIYKDEVEKSFGEGDS